MEKSIVDFVLEVITAVGAIGAGITALIGVFQFIKKFSYQNETLYGDEAVERFGKIEENVQKERLLGAYPLKRGPTTIIPQLKIARFRYNPQTMPSDYKGYTQSVRYITHDDPAGKAPDKSSTERVWLLK
jgi:hypothetical protein